MDKLIGHRGIKNYAPENTMAGFNLAKNYFKWVEIDATLTSDEKVVLFHDKKINDLTNDSGYIGEKSLKQLSSITVAEQPIPTLQDFLQFAINNDLYVNLEIKDNDKRWKLLTDKIIDKVITSSIDTNKILFSSFNHNALIHLNTQQPNWTIGHLFDTDLANWQEKCQAVNAKSLHLWNQNAHNKIISQAKAIGLEIYIYTVNNKAEYDKFINLGVNGVFTDEKPENIL